MKEASQESIDVAKQNISWSIFDGNEQLVVPEALMAEFLNNSEAITFSKILATLKKGVDSRAPVSLKVGNQRKTNNEIVKLAGLKIKTETRNKTGYYIDRGTALTPRKVLLPIVQFYQ